MENPRITALLHMVQEDPTDPFVFYALGLEYVSVDKQKACDYFEKLVNQWPEYLGTYFQYSNLLWDMGMHEQCFHILKRGIEVARKTKDTHTLAELNNSLRNKELGIED